MVVISGLERKQGEGEIRRDEGQGIIDKKDQNIEMDCIEIYRNMYVSV